jgi:retron-type reverse transcriptase/uncharacterized small protein (DUF1192 family)
MHENREISCTSWSKDQDRSAKALNRTADVHVQEKSDCAVIPVNQPNKEGQPSAEVGEGRAQIEENIARSHMPPTQSGKRMSQGLRGVRKAATERKQEKFTALLHHVTVDLLRDGFYALQRRAAPGVDGVTWREYETGLEDRLVDLHNRVHRRAYRAQPSRRVYIPKADGRQRPLGIAALEDKIVQQAVVTILNQIYEVDFKGFSYGFRPGRGPHQALDALNVGIFRKRVNWVLDADIRGFFDNMNHEWTMKFIEHRVADRRMLGLIQKWLKAGVSEDGQWAETNVGTPQGAVISPLLANVYLHYVFDLWPLRTITRDQLQRLLDEKSETLSRSIVDHLRWDLNNILKTAMSDGLIESNPAAGLFTPSCKEPGEKLCLSKAEIRLALSELDLRERLIFRLGVLGGMRPGEILAIRLGNIRKDSILIDQRVYKGNIDTPKGRKGKRTSRTMALSAGTLADVAEWRPSLLDQSPEAYLFPSERQTPMSKDNLWRRNMLPRLQTIGLGWATFQVMRRTNASLSRKAKVDDKVAADQRGHGLGVSLEVYSLSDLEQKIEAVNRLEAEVVKK